MRRLLLSTLLTTWAMCFAFAASAAMPWLDEPMRPVVLDARSGALGNAEIFGARSSNALFTNPAAMPFDQTVFQMGLTMRTGEFETVFISVDFDRSVEFSKKSVEYENRIIPPVFSLSTPVFSSRSSDGLQVVAGLGVGSFFDRSANYGYTKILEPVVAHMCSQGGRETAAATDTEFRLRLNQICVIRTISPSLAFSMKDNKYRFGVTWHQLVGSKYESEYYSSFRVIGSDWDDESNSYTEQDQRYDAEGSFFTFGAAVRVSERIDVGATLRTNLKTRKNDYSNWLEEHRWYGREIVKDYSETLPGALGVSVAYELPHKVRALGEFQLVNTSDMKSVCCGEDDPEFRYPPFEFKNSTAFRFGVETTGSFQARLGFFSEPVAITDNSLNEDKVKPNRRIGWTGGFGYRNGSLILDAFLQESYVKQEWKLVDGSTSDSRIEHLLYGLTIGWVLQ